MIRVARYTITATSLSPIRIGGREDPLSEADNPVAVVGGHVCVPGPSLKGALRNELERHLNDEFYDTRSGRWPSAELAMQPCIPSTRPWRDEQRLIEEARYKPRACHYPDNKGGICPVCYLLGAQGLVGFSNIPFLFTDVSYGELYSASLDRVTRISMGGNRSYQLIPPNSQFTGVLAVTISDDLPGLQLGRPRALAESKGDAWLVNGDWLPAKILREFVLDRIMAIKSLGGYRSKGFGGVAITAEEITEPEERIAPH
jgi:CRISPR/Cas system CSM-associated protein Csm3 (group 7 of RAMP superfamily)